MCSMNQKTYNAFKKELSLRGIDFRIVKGATKGCYHLHTDNEYMLIIIR